MALRFRADRAPEVGARPPSAAVSSGATEGESATAGQAHERSRVRGSRIAVSDVGRPGSPTSTATVISRNSACISA